VSTVTVRRVLEAIVRSIPVVLQIRPGNVANGIETSEAVVAESVA